MSIPFWSLFIGILLITMVLAGTLFARLLLSSAMIYLVAGYLLGPGALGVITPDPALYADVLERVAEAALLISLFSVGLKMGNVPLFDRRWLLPLRLGFITTAITVSLIAAIGVWWLGLSLGAAVLLGGILAPTDPVLAAGVQSKGGMGQGRLRFSLAGEGGLNDGTAFPFVLLGLGLLGWHDLGAGGWRWWVVDTLWAIGGGLSLGAILGALIGGLVVYLRTRHQQAEGLDEFISLGLLTVTYGTAQLCHASGFLAVLAAGLALRRVWERPLFVMPNASGHTYRELATTSGTMTYGVLAFNEQLEKLAELAIVLLVGAMLPYIVPRFELWWFIPLLFIILRPVAVSAGVLGEPITLVHRAMISWLGIRGIGSIYYLMFSIRHGVEGGLAQELIAFTLVTVAVSIVVHGISTLPLMLWYRKLRR